MVIKTFNPETEDLEKTFLSSPISAGATSLSVMNNDRIAANQRIMIGEMGGEKTEVVTVSAVSGDNTVTVGATSFSHTASTPVYVLRFDQVKVYRSTDGGSNYSILATVDLDVDNDGLQTSYDDTVGLATYYYKTTLYHSVSGVESSFSDPIQGSGYKRNQVGYIIDEVLQEVGDQAEQMVTRTELMGYFNDVNDDLLTYAGKPFDFLRTRTTLTRTANAITLDFPTDANGDQSMWKFDRMDYNYGDVTTDPDTDQMKTIKVMPEEEFRNRYSDVEIVSTNVSDAMPEVISLDTAVNKFRYWPASATTIANAFYLYYWKFFTRLDSEGDEIETPTPKIYKTFLKAAYYFKKAATEPSYLRLAQKWDNEYVLERARYTSHNRRDAGTPRGFRPVSRDQKRYRR